VKAMSSSPSTEKKKKMRANWLIVLLRSSISFLIVFVVLEFELRASHLVAGALPLELCPQVNFCLVLLIIERGQSPTTVVNFLFLSDSVNFCWVFCGSLC
jgi:hypothetical protein